MLENCEGLPVDLQTLWRMSLDEVAAISRFAPGFRYETDDSYRLVQTGIPDTGYNLGLVYGNNALEEGLHFCCHHLRRNDSTGVVIVSAVADYSLRRLVVRLGLQYTDREPHMICRPEDLVTKDKPTSGKMVAVDDPNELLDANGVKARAFGIPVDAVNAAIGPEVLQDPSVQMTLTYLDGKPASTITTVRHPEQGVVGILDVATAPEFQGRGLARAGLEQVLRVSFADGYALAHLSASPDGLRLYPRMGFKTVDMPTVIGVGPLR